MVINFTTIQVLEIVKIPRRCRNGKILTKESPSTSLFYKVRKWRFQTVNPSPSLPPPLPPSLSPSTKDLSKI